MAEVDAKLLEILVCPLTKGPLVYDRAAQELVSVEAGLAYAWLPEHAIAASLSAQRLKVLPLESGASRKVPLYLVLVQPARAGPAAQATVELLHRYALDGPQAASS